MEHWISAEDRTAFKRCRRQWDLGSPNRSNLEPVRAVTEPLPGAVRDALAVYYYPGMWDWPSPIVLPLVRKAFLRSLGETGEHSPVARQGGAILRHYVEVAPGIDDFSPVQIDHEVNGVLPDPRDPDRGLVDAAGLRVSYHCRVDLLAIDSADAYWVVRHQLVPRWQSIEALLLDEELLAACWAAEQTYLGMRIAGTIHNEVLSTGLPDPAELRASWAELPERGGIAQHEPSGGGRSIPRHRRQYGKPEQTTDDRVARLDSGGVRRTKILRGRQEVEQIGRQLGVEAVQMIDDAVAVYPTPAEQHCAPCPFLRPCLRMFEHGSADEALRSGYRRKPDGPVRGRLGGSSSGIGRGGLSFGDD